jgi:hypothetical protein
VVVSEIAEKKIAETISKLFAILVTNCEGQDLATFKGTLCSKLKTELNKL